MGRSRSRQKWRCRMPRMQSAAVQCCMCLTGVFMFLGGLIMLSTGICLILNYGVFDVELLPPDLQNDEGKKTVGIILTSCGLVAILISVIVSLMYLCNKTKSPVVIPDDLTRIPSTARQTPDKLDRHDHRGRTNHGFHPERRTSTGKPIGKPVTSSSSRTQVTKKSIPGSTEVKMPRQAYKRKHKKYPKRRLEEIKEQDAISRKTTEGIISTEVENFNDTPRSGSFSSEMTYDDPNKIPKVVLEHDYDERRPSIDSASTSQTVTSDTSSFRLTDQNNVRLQSIPSTVQESCTVQGMDRNYQDQDQSDFVEDFSKDSVAILQKENSSVVYNKGRDSDNSSDMSGSLANRQLDSSLSNNQEFSTGGYYTQNEHAQMTNEGDVINKNGWFSREAPSIDDLDSASGDITSNATVELPSKAESPTDLV